MRFLSLSIAEGFEALMCGEGTVHRCLSPKSGSQKVFGSGAPQAHMLTYTTQVTYMTLTQTCLLWAQFSYARAVLARQGTDRVLTILALCCLAFSCGGTWMPHLAFALPRGAQVAQLTFSHKDEE